MGQMVIGRLAGHDVLIMQGRAHPYEGISLQHATLPVRVMHELGIGTLIVTNAGRGAESRLAHRRPDVDHRSYRPGRQ